MKNFKNCKNYQNVMETCSEQMLLEDLLEERLQKPSIWGEKKETQYLHNKMRYACISIILKSSYGNVKYVKMCTFAYISYYIIKHFSPFF